MNVFHKKLKAIIFDYDGVIVDSLSTTVKKYRLLLRYFNKDKPMDENILKNGWRGNWKEFYRNHLGFSEDEIGKSIPIYRSLNVEEYIPPIVEGMQDVITQLARDFMLIIVSSGYVQNIIPVLQRNDIAGAFHRIYGSDELSGFSKPQPQAFLIPIRDLGLNQEEVFTVGDSVDDIRTAHAAKLPVVACTWGWNSRELLGVESPEFIAENPQGLYNIFTSMI